MIRKAALFIALIPVATPAFAHHGGGSFDLSKSVTYNGVLTKVELVNPHSWLYFDVAGPDGKMSHHRCEMRSVHVLRRSGWDKEQFPAGSAITVDAVTAAAAKFQQQYNPRFHCETTSILFDWTFDGAVNRITQKKDIIELLYGQMGLKRTIYLNMKNHPRDAKLTRAGHSIGHWED